jgi:hypothetical protein
VDCCNVEPSEPPGPAPGAGSGWRRGGSVASAIAVALLPKCPACWSAYAGLSSLLGLSFVVEQRYLLPLTTLLLALALAALALQARRARSYGPLALAALAAATTLAGKFALESDVLLYSGLGSLLLASLWSSCRGAQRLALLRRWLSGRAAPDSAPARVLESAPAAAQN